MASLTRSVGRPKAATGKAGQQFAVIRHSYSHHYGVLLGDHHPLGCSHGHGPLGYAGHYGYVVRFVPRYVDVDDGGHDALISGAPRDAV